MIGAGGAVLFLLLGLIGLAAGAPLLLIVGGMALLVIGGAWLWSRVSLERLTYQRTLTQGRVFAGEEISLSVSLTNRKPVPLGWVRLEDGLPEGLKITEIAAGATSPFQKLHISERTSLGSYERVRWTYRVRCPHRGIYTLGPAKLETGDPFGLFPRQMDLPDPDFLVVYPRIIPMPELMLPARWPLGDRRGSQRLHQDPARPSGVREYQPGDPWKYMDWKATARRNSLQVKIFEPGSSLLTLLLANIDTTGIPYGGSIPQHLERVMTVTASLAQDALAASRSVGFISNGKSVLYERPMSVPPGRSREQLPLILEALAMVTPYVGAPMEEQLLKAVRTLPAGATTVLITAIITPGLRHALELLLRQGRAPLVLWVAGWAPEDLPQGIEWRDLHYYLTTQEKEHGAAA
jgi:uncharacterized protein (DUF58 family)